MLIDVHCHLDFLSTPEETIKNAIKNNVKIIVANSVNPKSIKKTLELSDKIKEVKAALGIYPIDALSLSASDLAAQLQFIEKNKDKILAIGEVGVDFKEELLHHEQQIDNFNKFIKLAEKLNIPIIVHSRKAEAVCIEILETSKAKKVIMHYFSGSMNLVKRAIVNKWFLSIPTCVTYSEHFQKVVALAPLDQLFCETDSPYSHPQKQFPNEPANVLFSYKKIAEIKEIPLKAIEKQIEDNFNELFSS